MEDLYNISLLLLIILNKIRKAIKIIIYYKRNNRPNKIIVFSNLKKNRNVKFFLIFYDCIIYFT